MNRSKWLIKKYCTLNSSRCFMSVLKERFSSFKYNLSSNRSMADNFILGF